MLRSHRKQFEEFDEMGKTNEDGLLLKFANSEKSENK